MKIKIYEINTNELLSSFDVDKSEQAYAYAKQMEEMGIGRPSTYAPTISTIQSREYVTKEDRPGRSRTLKGLVLSENKVSPLEKTEKTGYEKSKLFPTDIGIVVNDFLVEHFAFSQNIVPFFSKFEFNFGNTLNKFII